MSKDMPRLHYEGGFDLAKIPIIRFATRNSFDVQNYLGRTEPKAMAIIPTGKVYAAYSTVSLIVAEETALKKCNWDPANELNWGPCFLYAINNDVVLSKRLIGPQR